MANKILFIGVGGAGSIMADKAMRDYPELFDSVTLMTNQQDLQLSRRMSRRWLMRISTRLSTSLIDIRMIA